MRTLLVGGATTKAMYTAWLPPAPGFMMETLLAYWKLRQDMHDNMELKDGDPVSGGSISHREKY
jgi:hypothetical protein